MATYDEAIRELYALEEEFSRAKLAATEEQARAQWLARERRRIDEAVVEMAAQARKVEEEIAAAEDKIDMLEKMAESHRQSVKREKEVEAALRATLEEEKARGRREADMWRSKLDARRKQADEQEATLREIPGYARWQEQRTKLAKAEALREDVEALRRKLAERGEARKRRHGELEARKRRKAEARNARVEEMKKRKELLTKDLEWRRELLKKKQEEETLAAAEKEAVVVATNPPVAEESSAAAVSSPRQAVAPSETAPVPARQDAAMDGPPSLPLRPGVGDKKPAGLPLPQLSIRQRKPSSLAPVVVATEASGKESLRPPPTKRLSLELRVPAAQAGGETAATTMQGSSGAPARKVSAAVATVLPPLFSSRFEASPGDAAIGGNADQPAAVGQSHVSAPDPSVADKNKDVSCADVVLSSPQPSAPGTVNLRSSSTLGPLEMQQVMTSTPTSESDMQHRQLQQQQKQAGATATSDTADMSETRRDFLSDLRPGAQAGQQEPLPPPPLPRRPAVDIESLQPAPVVWKSPGGAADVSAASSGFAFDFGQRPASGEGRGDASAGSGGGGFLSIFGVASSDKSGEVTEGGGGGEGGDASFNFFAFGGADKERGGNDGGAFAGFNF